MNQDNNNTTNLILFMVVTITIFIGWNYLFPNKTKQQITSKQEQTIDNNSTQTLNNNLPSTIINKDNKLSNQELIKITTDTTLTKIDLLSGDIRELQLLKYNDFDNEKELFTLLENSKTNKYIAQSGILDENNQYILDNIPFQTEQKEYSLGDKKELSIILTKTNGDITLKKIFTFHKDSYLIDITYEVNNNTNNDLNLTLMHRLLRDDSTPKGSNFFARTYTGPVIYTPEHKFKKIDFEDINENKAKYDKNVKSGWLGYIQHYFTTILILQSKDEKSICNQSTSCIIDLNRRDSDKLYSVGFLTKLNTIKANSSLTKTVKLYAGPQEYKHLSGLADNLQLVKDYGKVHIFASPLFWVLQKIHSYVNNWGWAIVLLVILIKILFFPLTHASYKSMAKMSKVAPRMNELKQLYADDKVKMQQEIMALYKKEKINPLGGCLPVLIQIPIFIGLYWALFNSVELMQAPWILWIHDLSKLDPYYILPSIMAATTFLQTLLQPPATDPLQAKMMKIMPLIFSVMFFFFPAGLVLYWIVNNILSILQQWIIKRQYTNK